ncbi:MAG: hypothetical protein WCV90_04155 [Candidatus Woesearchaeota archaeon]|jgi:hypothetical protein
MEENQDLVERLKVYNMDRIGQLAEIYHLMEKRPLTEYTLLELQRQFKGFPVKERELTLFLDLHARCNGNSGLVFEEAIHQRMETIIEATRRYEEVFLKPYRN